MAEYRYWRAVGLTPYDGALTELTEFQLLSGTTRVDAAASLSASNGADMSALSDGGSAVAVKLPRGVFLMWDFGGAPAEVTDIRLGSADAQAGFALHVKLECSADGLAWATSCSYWGIAWPGPRMLTSSAMGFPRTPDNESVQLLVDFEEPGIPRNLAFAGGPLVQYDGTSAGRSTAQARFGSASWQAGTNTSRVQVDGVSYQGEDFTLQAWTYFNGAAVANWSHLLQLGSGINNRVNMGVYNGAYVLYSVNSRETSNPGTGRPVIPNTWVHLALVRTGSVHTMYVDGDVVYSGSSASGLEAFGAGSIALGMQQFGGYSGDRWLGWIDDVCVSFRAEYTGSFAVPSMPRSAQVSTILTNRFGGRVLANSPAMIATAGVMPPVKSTQLSQAARSRTNFLFDRTANGRIRGTVERDATPADVPMRRRVSLLRDIDLMVVQQQWSDAVTGAYDFKYVETDQAYTVIAHDYEHNYRAVIADNLSLATGGMELMP